MESTQIMIVSLDLFSVYLKTIEHLNVKLLNLYVYCNF